MTHTKAKVTRTYRIPPDERRCKAKVSNGSRRCKRPAIRGGTVCQTHGGMAPQVKAAAKRRLALQEGIAAVAGLGLPEPDGRHPVEHLMSGLTLSSMLVETLGRVVNETNARPGTETYDEWARERDRHVRIAKACADAGVEERMVRVQELQAQQFVTALRGILADLGVDDHPQVGAVVRRHLLALAAGDGDG